MFKVSLEYSKDVYTCFVDLRKHMTRSLMKSLGECWVSSADGRLLLVVKSMHSCSEVCVGRVTSQLFIIGVGLQQGCVLSITLLHSLY